MLWAWPTIAMIIVGCASHRYGAYFQDDTKVNSANYSLAVASTNRIHEMHEKNISVPPAVAPLRNEGNPMNKQDVTIKESKHTFTLRKTEIKLIKQELKKAVLNYERTDKPDSIESIKEMPRYKYLTWSGILALVGIVLVAFSASAGAVGVLATIAFTGALIFLILWILKK